VRAALRDGATVFVNCIAFAEDAVTALLALLDGDSVALAGELTPKVYQPQTGEPRPSLDLLVHAVLTQYHVARKRKAVEGSGTADVGEWA
jgi:single-stranded DNA-binding protein